MNILLALNFLASCGSFTSSTQTRLNVAETSAIYLDEYDGDIYARGWSQDSEYCIEVVQDIEHGEENALFRGCGPNEQFEVYFIDDTKFHVRLVVKSKNDGSFRTRTLYPSADGGLEEWTADGTK